MQPGPKPQADKRGDELPPSEVERRAMDAARRLLTTPKAGLPVRGPVGGGKGAPSPRTAGPKPKARGGR